MPFKLAPNRYVEVVSDEEAKAAKAEAKRRAALAEKEAAMGEVEPMSDEELAALRAEAGTPPEGASSSGGGGAEEGGDKPGVGGGVSAVPAGATALEVHEGPFKAGSRPRVTRSFDRSTDRVHVSLVHSIARLVASTCHSFICCSRLTKKA